MKHGVVNDRELPTKVSVGPIIPEEMYRTEQMVKVHTVGYHTITLFIQGQDITVVSEWSPWSCVWKCLRSAK